MNFKDPGLHSKTHTMLSVKTFTMLMLTITLFTDQPTPRVSVFFARAHRFFSFKFTKQYKDGRFKSAACFQPFIRDLKYICHNFSCTTKNEISQQKHTSLYFEQANFKLSGRFFSCHISQYRQKSLENSLEIHKKG